VRHRARKRKRKRKRAKASPELPPEIHDESEQRCKCDPEVGKILPERFLLLRILELFHVLGSAA